MEFVVVSTHTSFCLSFIITLILFKIHWESSLFHLVCCLGPVHTNPFSNKNWAVLFWIQLSSTLQCRKRSPKMEPFENALQSGANWKRCFWKTLFTSVDGENDAIWKCWRHQNRHDRAPDHSTVTIQIGGQTLPCGFNSAPVLLADIFKCACVEFIWACTLRVQKRFQNRYGIVVWRGENDTKTISVDANLFENRAKQLHFPLKMD